MTLIATDIQISEEMKLHLQYTKNEQTIYSNLRLNRVK